MIALLAAVVLGTHHGQAQAPSPLVPSVQWKAQPEPEARGASDEIFPLIPKPQINQLHYDRAIELTGAYSFPIGRFQYFEDFTQALARRFVLPVVTAKTAKVPFDGGESKMGMRPGSYRLTIEKDGVSIIGEEEEGVRNGARRLAELAFVRDGKLMLPTGTILCQPLNAWRGILLSAGPHALEFQRRLWERVLLPLGFNKVVIECEYTHWKSTPGIDVPQTTSREDLVKLFAMYRSLGVEPIPLVQSFGHAEWLFKNGQNLDLAFNPEVPYTIDPRKPRSRELLTALWDEIIETLKPSMVHFGCDEVDMRGFPNDPKLTTELWQAQIPFLGEIASKHQVKMMIWGDKGLAPGQAVDATFGNDRIEAAKRRAVIPVGAWIGDWHYAGNPDAGAYQKSIDLWKNEGFNPVASPWFNLKNIEGLYRAAYYEHIPTLQTTWAGWDSNEQTMLEQWRQFFAMVPAGDLTWTPNPNPIEKCGYDPSEVLRRMYFSGPLPVKPMRGLMFATEGAKTTTIEGSKVLIGEPIQLKCTSVPSGASEVSVVTPGKATAVIVALQTATVVKDGDEVARLVVQLDGGKKVERVLRYGWDVRAVEDPNNCFRAARASFISAVALSIGEKPITVKAVQLLPISADAGLRLFGITLVGG